MARDTKHMAPAMSNNGKATSSSGRGPGGRGPNDDQQISQILAEMSQQQRESPEASSSRTPARPGDSSTPTSSADTVSGTALAATGPPNTSHPKGAPTAGVAQGKPFFPQSPELDLPLGSTTQPGIPVSQPPDSASPGALSSSASALPLARERDELSASPVVAGSSAKGKAAAKGRGRGKSDERMGMNEEEWERSRKDNHKEVERRRRETINAGITQLGFLLPPEVPPAPAPPPTAPVFGAADPSHASNSSAGMSAAVGPASSATSSTAPTSSTGKVNKAHVLTRAAAYIAELREQQARTIDQWTLDKLLADQHLKSARDEADRLRRENEALRQRVVALGGDSDVVVDANGEAGAAAHAGGGVKRAAYSDGVPAAVNGADLSKKARVEK